MMSHRVRRCIDCGFLGVAKADADMVPPRGISEVDFIEWLRYWNRIVELTSTGREAIAKHRYIYPEQLRCIRNVCPAEIKEKTGEEKLSYMSEDNECLYFFPYWPGVDPEHHLELLREHKTNELFQRISIRSTMIAAAAGLLGALLGAVAAIVAVYLRSN